MYTFGWLQRLQIYSLDGYRDYIYTHWMVTEIIFILFQMLLQRLNTPWIVTEIIFSLWIVTEILYAFCIVKRYIFTLWIDTV